MPRGNGTGPNGMGPMTGRGAGYCAGYGMPGYANSVGGAGRGFGRGFGFGRAWDRSWSRGAGWGCVAGGGFAPYPFDSAAPKGGEETERWNLERQAEYLEEEQKNIRARLDTLGKAPESETK